MSSTRPQNACWVKGRRARKAYVKGFKNGCEIKTLLHMRFTLQAPRRLDARVVFNALAPNTLVKLNATNLAISMIG